MDMRPLQSKLSSLRGRLRRLVGTLGALRVVLIGSAFLAITFALDWLFQLPFGARAVLWILGAATCLWGLWRHFVSPLRVPMKDDDLALLVEEKHPEYGSELISALQLERQLKAEDRGESKEMMASLVARASRRFASDSFDDAVPAGRLRKPALMVLGAALAFGGLTAAFPAPAKLLFKRCVLLSDEPWPPRTRLSVEIIGIERFRHQIEGDRIDLYVPENSTLPIRVRALGEVPSSVTIRKFREPRSRYRNSVGIEMSKKDGDNLFEFKFGRTNQSFEFFVEGGDDRDERPYFRVFVRRAPRLDDFSVDYDYPDYINEGGREDRVGVREYNVVGPKGSEVTLHFDASDPIDRFELILDEDREKAIVLKPDDESRRKFSWTTRLQRDGFYSYRMIGSNGTPSREAPNFNLSAQTDLSPSVAVSMPDVTSVDVSPTATMPLEINASDDLKVGAIRLRWDTDREGAFAQRFALDEGDFQWADERRELRLFKALDFRGLELVEEGKARALQAGDAIHLRIEVEDTRRTEANPEPNETVYPTLLTFHVREPGEIERELLRNQVRTKDQMERAQEAVLIRIEDIERLLAGTGDGSAAPDVNGGLEGLVAAQSLITSSLEEAARGFVRVFDGHLFNRTDSSALTETLISKIMALHRQEAGTHYDVLTRLLPEERARFDESEAMGKLSRIMDLLIVAAGEKSPGVDSLIKVAVQTEEAPKRAEALRSVLASERELGNLLATLIEKMEDWEDFQDVIQSLKDILDLQKGLTDRVETIVR